MWRLAAGALALAAAGCGGGGSDSAPAPGGSAECGLEAQKAWLRDYMADWYLWTGLSPTPSPAGFSSVEAYFDALLYTGSATVPADRWSYIEDSETYNQFFGAGKAMGYGIFVNGLELTLPLKIRYVEPASPAALAGLKRGDVILSANGRSAADMVSANDFAVFTAAAAGNVLTLEIAQGVGSKTVAVTAATYDLTPVSTAKVLILPDGKRAGYLVLKDFVTQAEQDLALAFAQFRTASATELILDLRYNGGGRVSTANALASLIAGSGRSGQVFTRLRYNSRHSSSDTNFTLAGGPAPAFGRVVILAGRRTCSASEMLVNGLKPYAEVVTIGETTCGKPVGFNAVESCGNVYSAVNFDNVNARGEGAYYDGLAATCAVAEDFSGEMGDLGETLTGAAAAYLQTGACPVGRSESPQAVGPRAAKRLLPPPRFTDAQH